MVTECDKQNGKEGEKERERERGKEGLKRMNVD